MYILKEKNGFEQEGIRSDMKSSYKLLTFLSNHRKKFSCYVFEVGVAYRENMDGVMDVLRKIGAELQNDEVYGPLIKDPLDVAGRDSFGD